MSGNSRRHPRPGRGRTLSPGAYLQRLYRRFGFGGENDTVGMMILVSEAHDTAFIQLPREWPKALREQIKIAVSDIMLGGTGVDVIDALVRTASAG